MTMKLFDKYFQPYAEYCIRTTFSEDELKEALAQAIMDTFVDVLKEQVKDLKGATRNLMKNALLDIAKDFCIKMTDKIMNKIASDFVSNLLHATSIWTRVHYKECEKIFLSLVFRIKRQSGDNVVWEVHGGCMIINDVEKCKEAHEYSWREK